LKQSRESVSTNQSTAFLLIM